LWILIAVFGLVIAVIFKMYPSAVFPVWTEIPIAVILGYYINKKGKNVWAWSIYAVIIMLGLSYSFVKDSISVWIFCIQNFQTEQREKSKSLALYVFYGL
jgi:carbon starvation protein